MRKTILCILILQILISCNSTSKEVKNELTDLSESTQIEKIDSIVKYRSDGTKEYIIPTVNGIKTGNKLWFDNNQNIIGFQHYQNDSLGGFGLILNDNFRPKYLFENNNGKRNGVLIEFYENGVIKSFRNADIFHDSQNIDFHENGTIRRIGQTKKGRGSGPTFYFNEKGILEKTAELSNGNVKE